jgi:hypothetical protein
MECNILVQNKRPGILSLIPDLFHIYLLKSLQACYFGLQLHPLPFGKWIATEAQKNMAAAQLQNADLFGGQLQEVNLHGAQFIFDCRFLHP